MTSKSNGLKWRVCVDNDFEANPHSQHSRVSRWRPCRSGESETELHDCLYSLFLDGAADHAKVYLPSAPEGVTFQEYIEGLDQPDRLFSMPRMRGSALTRVSSLMFFAQDVEPEFMTAKGEYVPRIEEWLRGVLPPPARNITWPTKRLLLRYKWLLAWAMLRYYSLPDPGFAHYQAAAKQTGSGEQFGDGDQEARRELAGRLRDEIAAFSEKVLAFAEDQHPPLERDGMLWLDSLFFDHLDGIGKQAKKSAEEGRRNARDRWEDGDVSRVWRLWFDEDELGPFCHFAPLLAKYLWRDQVKPELERVRKNRPSLALAVYDAVEATAWHKGRKVEKNSDQLSLLSEEDELLAQTPFLPDERLQKILEAGADELRSITAIRLFIHLVRTVHQRHFQGVHDSTVLEFEGGIQALAEEIGETSGKGRAKLKAILEAGQRWHVSWPGGEAGGLWTYWYDDTSGSHKSAKLELRLGAPLAPMYSLKRLRKDQHVLTPIVEMAPLVDPGRYFAPQAAFQQAVVRAIVDRRMQVADEKGALLPPADLWPTAKRLGLPQSTMERALDRWQHDGDDGPAFLDLVDRDRYHLADNELYGLARRFIDETARRAKRGRARGKASARKRKGDD